MAALVICPSVRNAYMPAVTADNAINQLLSFRMRYEEKSYTPYNTAGVEFLSVAQ
ncbi:MAG: hypothetical protein JWR76_2332 [Mucilaginibacter sp.]|nr:hypothetical protein [Mucilaginibacter sp.]